MTGRPALPVRRYGSRHGAPGAMDGPLGASATASLEAANNYRILGYFENGFPHPARAGAPAPRRYPDEPGTRPPPPHSRRTDPGTTPAPPPANDAQAAPDGAPNASAEAPPRRAPVETLDHDLRGLSIRVLGAQRRTFELLGAESPDGYRSCTGHGPAGSLPARATSLPCSKRAG